MTTNDSNDPTTEELEAANRMLMEMEQTHLQEFGEIPDWILTAKLAVLKELQRETDAGSDQTDSRAKTVLRKLQRQVNRL